MKYNNKIIKIIIGITSFFVLGFIGFTFIHELFHVIISLSFGNPLKSIIFTYVIEDNFFSIGVGVIFNRINESAILWVSIAGSIGSILICIPFLIYSVYKRSVIYAFIFSIVIIREFLYWTIGFYYNIGDPYNFLWALEHQFNILLNRIDLFYYFLIMDFLLLGIYILVIYRTWRLKEIDLYGV